MYDGAWMTTPTMGTVSSEKRNGASSIPRKRDLAFILDQGELTGDLVHDRIRSWSDSDTRDRPGRKLRQARVLHERRRQVQRPSFRLTRPAIREASAVGDRLLMACRGPLAGP